MKVIAKGLVFTSRILFFGSLRKDTSVKSISKETSIPIVTLNISNTNTNINLGAPQQTTIPKKTLVKPSRVSNIESGKEEIGILDIIVELYNKGTNVNMDEGMLNNEYLITSTIETSIALPPLSSPITIYVPVLTISPPFFGVMQEPITTLFSSQSTEKVILRKRR